jgi:hypothetical protein
VHEHGRVGLVDVMPRFAPVGKTANACDRAGGTVTGARDKQVNGPRVSLPGGIAHAKPRKW